MNCANMSLAIPAPKQLNKVVWEQSRGCVVGNCFSKCFHYQRSVLTQSHESRQYEPSGSCAKTVKQSCVRAQIKLCESRGCVVGNCFSICFYYPRSFLTQSHKSRQYEPSDSCAKTVKQSCVRAETKLCESRGCVVGICFSKRFHYPRSVLNQSHESR